MTEIPQSPHDAITAEVTSWPGVTAGVGPRGEWAFKLGGRELGHMHGDHVAHLFFPEDAWERLHAEGRIGFHPVFPERRGPAARRIDGPRDVVDVVAMLRFNYERILARRKARAA